MTISTIEMLKHFGDEIKKNNLGAAKFMVKFFPDTLKSEECDCDGDMFLHIAVRSDDFELVRRTLEQSAAAIGIQNQSNHTPLGIAIILGNIRVSKLLIDNGASLGNVNFDGNESPLAVSARNDNIDFMRYLLDDVKVDINHEDSESGNTALMASIFDSDDVDGVDNLHLKSIKFLIGRKASLFTSADVFPAFFRAAVLNKVSVLRLMTSHPQWDVNFRHPDRGITMLDIAAHNKQEELCRFLLIQPGLNINSASSHGTTASMHAATGPNFHIMNLFAEKGADMYQKNTQGFHTLNIATFWINNNNAP